MSTEEPAPPPVPEEVERRGFEIFPGVIYVPIDSLEDASQVLKDPPEKFDLKNWAPTLTSGANVLVQAGNGISQATGLVRLTEDTRAAMAAGAQVMKVNGAFGGVLTTGGKIAEHIRWLPAVGGQALAVLSTLGPAASMFAITLQHVALSARLGRVEKMQNQILKELHLQHDSKLKAAYRTVQEAINQVTATGSLSDVLRQQLISTDTQLDEAFHTFKSKLSEYSTSGQGVTPEEVRQIPSTAKAALYAIAMRFQGRTLLAWQDREMGRSDAEYTYNTVLKRRRDDTNEIEQHCRRIHRAALKNELLDKTPWGKVAEVPGKAAEAVGNFISSRFQKEQKEEPIILSLALEQLQPELADVVPDDAVVVGVQPDSPEVKLAALGLAELTPEDTLVGLAIADNQALVISERTFHAPKLDYLKQRGALGKSSDLTELRYLRLSAPEGKDKDYQLDLHWKNRSDCFTFKPTTATPEWKTALATFFELLAEHAKRAQIPDEEFAAPRWLTAPDPTEEAKPALAAPEEKEEETTTT